jgi:hypothetical protein
MGSKEIDKQVITHPYLHKPNNKLVSANDTPPSSLTNSTTNPKVTTMEGEGVGARSLAHITLRVKGHAGALGWD